MEVTPLGPIRPTVTPAPPAAATATPTSQPTAEPIAPAAPHVFGRPLGPLQDGTAPAPQLLAERVDRPVEVRLRVHPVTRSMVMSLVDQQTGEVVGQLPPEQVLDIVSEVIHLLREGN